MTRRAMILVKEWIKTVPRNNLLITKSLSSFQNLSETKRWHKEGQAGVTEGYKVD